MDDRLRRLLSNPYRVMILRSIGTDGSTFSEIKEKTGLSTGTIYHHIYVMSDLIYKDRKRYYLTKAGKKIYSLVVSGSYYLEEYKEPIIRLDRVIKLILLSGLFKRLYSSRFLPAISGIAFAMHIWTSMELRVGYLLFTPIVRPPMEPPLSTILSVVAILAVYYIVIYFSVGTEYSIAEWMNIGLVSLIPMAILSIIPGLFYYTPIDNRYLFSFIQFFSAFYVATAMSVSSGLKIDRSFAVAGFLLFIGEIIL